MKISQTIIATDANGNDLPDAKPVDMLWASHTDELGVMTSVAQMLAHARDRKFTRTLAITIEL